jgi:hypothetical protein
VNHDEAFQNMEGFDTNFAESFFSRLRKCQDGAWHRMSVQFVEYYGWETAWRQSMTGHDNGYQFRDLLQRLFSSARTARFADYWGKKDGEVSGEPEPGDIGFAVEVPKSQVRQKVGRKAKGRLKESVPKPVRKRTKPQKLELADKVPQSAENEAVHPPSPPQSRLPAVSWTTAAVAMAAPPRDPTPVSEDSDADFDW